MTVRDLRALSILVLWAAVGCGRPRQAVLITIDSLRDDAVGPRREGASLTPALDRLRADGVRFSDSLTSATTTMASHASMLTGLRPHRHGLQGNDGELDPAMVTIGALLREHGVRTGAVVSSFVLRSEGGLAAGFESYDESFDAAEESRSGQKVKSPATTTRAALEWVRRHREESFFLWVHYFPPHGPYTPPSAFLVGAEGGPGSGGGEVLEISQGNYERGKLPKYQRLAGVKDVGAYRARYAGHVRYVDHHVGQLLDGLRELGVYDPALVLATADHGESLGDLGWFFCHGNLVYGEQARVPLVVKWPARERRGGLSCSAPVELVDLAPTILRFFGGEPAEELDGRALDGLLGDPASVAGRPRVTQSTDGEIVAVVAGPWKLTRRHEPARWVDEAQPRQELFRLDTDVGECEDRAFGEPDVVSWLAALIPQGRAPVRQRDLSSEKQEQLRALGYFDESPAARPGAVPSSPRSPCPSGSAVPGPPARRR